MNALKDPVPNLLSVPDAEGLVETARRRQQAMGRGNAAFSCRSLPGATPIPHAIPPECVRMDFSWRSHANWQARAWDAEEKLLSDTACDGQWIEAGGKRWPINFLDESDGVHNEDEAAERRRSEGIVELSRLLWCREACSNHLFLSSLLSNERLSGLSRDLLYRDSETGDIVYRLRQTDRGPHDFPSTLWDRLRWRWIHYLRPNFTFDELFGVPKAPLISDTRLYFDATQLHPLRTTHWLDDPGIGPRRELSERWEEPMRLANGYYISRVYELHKGLECNDLQYRMELLQDNSRIGDGAPVEVRPVDMTLPAVNW